MWTRMTHLDEVFAVFLGECGWEADEGVVIVLDETETGVGSSGRVGGLRFIPVRVAALSPAASAWSM